MFFLLDALIDYFELSTISKGLIASKNIQMLLNKLNRLNINASLKNLIFKRLANKSNIKNSFDLQAYFKRLKPNQIVEFQKELQTITSKLDFQKKFFTNLRNEIGNYVNNVKIDKQVDEELGNIPIDVIVPLKSSWVLSGLWIPIIKRGLGGNWLGIFMWDTKSNPGKFYTTPNFTSAQWEDIRLNWTTPQPPKAKAGTGHGAGSYLWEYNLLRKAGYNPLKVSKTFEKRISGGKYGVIYGVL